MTRTAARALVSIWLTAGCSSVPDVIFVDEDAAAEAGDGAVTIDADAASSSGGPAPRCVQVVPGVPLVCCGRMQCVGNECDRCNAECPGKCNDPDKKYCCQTGGKLECLDHGQRCGP